MKAIKHFITVAGILFLFLILPALIFVNFDTILGAAGYDAVSSATQIITDKPSGQYVILINKGLSEIDVWEEFFDDKDIPVIMEDISCLVISGDENGLEMARTYQSRLPENQMKIKQAEGLLTVSKAQNALFDVAVMSQEFADAYNAETVYGNENIEVITKQE